GLSYTKFNYSPIQLSSSEMAENGTLTVSVDVTNSGKYDGEEVVQLYIKDKVASVSRAVRELKAFEKIMLKKGEAKKVSFQITKEQLSFYRADMSYGTELGEFVVFIGGNSRDTQSATFLLKK
ncbi:MAG: beta-glucosidase, partial [Bacteroidetes bacterium]|nr:beta-glucosidase [Bacteroidota bacterium]